MFSLDDAVTLQNKLQPRMLKLWPHKGEQPSKNDKLNRIKRFRSKGREITKKNK